MSRKRILNVSSRKKADNMVVYANTTANIPTGSKDYFVNGAILKGGVTYIFPFAATARGLLNSDGDIAGPAEEATRTSTECYMRGYKEIVQIQTSSGMPWQWRRICFTMKGTRLSALTSDGYYLNRLTSSGYMRIVNNISGTTFGSNLVDLIFQGINGVDWVGIFNARTDDRLVDIKYDRTRLIQSGNASGVMRNYRHWHPMNETLVYGDEEAGMDERTSDYSTTGKGGMGDYYIVDIISAGTGATATDNLSFQPEAKLYWHER